MLLSLPFVVVLQKSGCCNAVTEARLLPVVHTSAQNRKYAFHERGGWLNQCVVLCDTIPTRQLKPVVIQELPQIVRAQRAAVNAVVRGRARALALLRRNTLVLAIAARSQDWKIGYAAASVALSAFFSSHERVGARARVCACLCVPV